MENLYLGLSAATMIVTALAHSVLGEKYLIQPIIHSELPLMRHLLARQVIRYAWHLTSVLWFVLAYLLFRPIWSGTSPDREFVLVVGAVHLIVGIFDVIATRGKHVGWPLLTATGIFALAAVVVSR